MNSDIAVAVFSDFLSFFKLWFPVNTGVVLIDAYREKRAQEAFNILISAIKSGDFSKVYNDDKIAIMYQFSLAIISGRANRNLMLLATLIKNICSGKQLNYGEYTEEYTKFAKILEDLDKDEITILAVYAKFAAEETDMISLYQKTKEYCMNNYIMDSATFLATCTALHRTGLMYNNGGLDGGAEIPTKRFFELKELVDLNIAYNNV